MTILWWIWTTITDSVWFVSAAIMAATGTLLLIFGNIVAVILNPASLLKLSFNSVATFAAKMLTTKGIRQAMDLRVITMDGKVRSVEAHRENAINRRDRMIQYVEKTKQFMQSVSNGPLGCSVLLEMTRDNDFYKARKYLEKCIKIFDELEGEIVHRIQRLDEEQNVIRELANGRLHKTECALARLKQRHAMALRRSLYPRHINRVWANLLDTNRKWNMVYACTKKRRSLYKHKKADLREVGKRYNRILKPHFARMHDFETEYLGHRIHEYQADFASFLQTVISGRTLGFLLEKNEMAEAMRAKFGLSMLPTNKPDAQKFFVEQLRGRCGYHLHLDCRAV
ncbi:MAG: hypothetical protein EON60_10905 [Alphaproteobacteria bacterium]|nr:MAG: hypothetical protein EON60_10905 [Alphaproteobacteria bacterium]